MLLSMSRLPEIENPRRKAYPSDLSDAEWLILKPLLPKPKGFGHPQEVDLREILNAIFYVQRTGCQWEMLPHDLPPYTTVDIFKNKERRQNRRSRTLRVNHEAAIVQSSTALAE
jgi:putative transposase